MIRTKRTKPRVLMLKREVIVELAPDRLKEVVGGNSLHPSQCIGFPCL